MHAFNLTSKISVACMCACRVEKEESITYLIKPPFVGAPSTKISIEEEET